MLMSEAERERGLPDARHAGYKGGATAAPEQFCDEQLQLPFSADKEAW